MAVTQEFREFFIRHIKVTSGTKPDQEANFPTTYYIGSTLVYNRFLKNDYPSESVFKKLFQSLTFKLNKEDTAKLTQQGLVKIATDANAESRTSNTSTDYTASVVPHQLPEIILTNGSGDTNVSTETAASLSIVTVKRTIASLFRRIYRIALVGDTATPGSNKVYSTNQAGTRGWNSVGSFIWENHIFPDGLRQFGATSSAYLTVATFIFPGTGVEGTITAFKAILYIVTGGTGKIKIIDVTNTTTIAEFTAGTTSTSESNVIDMGAIANLPAAQAVFAIQLSNSSIVATDETVLKALLIRK